VSRSIRSLHSPARARRARRGLSASSLGVLAAGLLLLRFASTAFAGPPFQTDDPEPVPYRHYEAYLFSTLDSTRNGTGTQGPAAEFNWGAVPNVQLHLVIPLAASIPPEGGTTFGLGDMEAGIKYRFIQQTKHRPEVGTFTMLEIPSGNPHKGLGNGQAWARLPIWLQKDEGPWTSFWGGGWTINRAPGMRDYAFAGWEVQRQVSKRLILGGEFFGHGSEGPASADSGAATLADLGGYYNLTKHCSLLFSLGHSMAGQADTLGYLGLYWTWGSSETAAKVTRLLQKF
jgi:hypothetical protein